MVDDNIKKSSYFFTIKLYFKYKDFEYIETYKGELATFLVLI